MKLKAKRNDGGSYKLLYSKAKYKNIHTEQEMAEKKEKKQKTEKKKNNETQRHR